MYCQCEIFYIIKKSSIVISLKKFDSYNNHRKLYSDNIKLFLMICILHTVHNIYRRNKLTIDYKKIV